jgi:hypothetical protein
MGNGEERFSLFARDLSSHGGSCTISDDGRDAHPTTRDFACGVGIGACRRKGSFEICARSQCWLRVPLRSRSIPLNYSFGVINGEEFPFLT